MIEVTNKTMKIPVLEICTPNGFWLGFFVGIVSIFILWFAIKMAFELKGGKNERN